MGRGVCLQLDQLPGHTGKAGNSDFHQHKHPSWHQGEGNTLLGAGVHAYLSLKWLWSYRQDVLQLKLLVTGSRSQKLPLSHFSELCSLALFSKKHAELPSGTCWRTPGKARTVLRRGQHPSHPSSSDSCCNDFKYIQFLPQRAQDPFPCSPRSPIRVETETAIKRTPQVLIRMAQVVELDS